MTLNRQRVATHHALPPNLRAKRASGFTPSRIRDSEQGRKPILRDKERQRPEKHDEFLVAKNSHQILNKIQGQS
jgi:hypothetical protein